MKKKVLSIVLIMCLLLNAVPVMTLADTADGAGEISVSAYASKEQLMTEFSTNSEGTASNTGKIIFGKNSASNPQEWYVLGKDSGVDGDNTAIFAASALIENICFEDNRDDNKTDSSLWSDCVYSDGSTPEEVYPNHYGASDLRYTLKSAAENTDYFSAAEQSLMNATPVTANDRKSAKEYTTSDKLYPMHGKYDYVVLWAGSNDSIKINQDYWYGDTYFWLRDPHGNSGQSALAARPDYAASDYYVNGAPGGSHPNARPAANINLSSVLFASAVPTEASESETTANAAAMALRLDGKDKGIGEVFYNSTIGIIKAQKGSTSKTVRLIVQGFDGTNNWYYAKQLDNTLMADVNAIKNSLDLTSDVDLSLCKIWLEITSDDGMTYAVSAEESSFAPSVGDGSAENPYRIGTAEELYGFAHIVNGGNASANAILTADITVNENVIYEYGGQLTDNTGNFAVWTPIGSSDNPYTGTFDGKNCTVSGLYINSSDSLCGLFGWNKGTVKNVGVMGSYIKGENSVGAVCGFNQGGTVSGCFNTGTVYGKRHIGGVCGWSDGTVIGCDSIGVIIGEENVGGVCGYNNGTVLGCYNRGTVAGDKTTGAVCGKNTADGRINSCYYLGGSDKNGIGDGTGSVSSVTASELKDGTVCTLLNSALISAGSEVRFYQGELYPVFVCTPKIVDGVYQIGNTAELYGFARLVNNGEQGANAVLTNDITVNTGDVTNCGGVNGGFAEWTPIGFSESGYTGSFDGKGHIISGLYFNNSSSKYVGLFGCVRGSVSNVGVENSYFSGDNAVGGICGSISFGTVENCYNTGTVNGYFLVGGVCGTIDGGTLKNSYNMGNVSGVTVWIGGVCGYLKGYNEYGRIINCYNSGSVSGGEHSVGGICGENSSATVVNSYSDSTVFSGNVIGVNRGTATDVEGKTTAEFKNGTVEYLLQNGDGGSVWGQDLSGVNNYPVLDSAKKAYLVKVTYCDNSTGTAYSNTDAPMTGVHKYEYSNGFCAGCANSNQPADYNEAGGYYEISNAGQLYWFANYVNNEKNNVNAVLLNNIVVNENLLGKLNDDGSVKDGYTVKSWTPIGSENNNFYGKFDGRGYTISGLYYNSSTDCVGLFGCAKGSGISNVVVADSYIKGSSFVGAVCGISYAPIVNCHNTGKVVGSSSVGGVCGGLYSDYGSSGSITVGSNSGTVNGSTNVGGICGINNCVITNCFNTGTVVGNSNVGGLVGYNSGTAVNAYNIGMVGGTENFGGICGGNGGTINNCYYNGDTFGGDAIGVDYNGTLTSTEKKTTSEFNSGSVAYLLSTGTDGSVWGQDLSAANSYPSFNTGKKVYQNRVYAGCAGNPGEPTGIIYTNTNKDVYSDHVDNNNDGVCDNGCGQYFRAVVYEVSATLDGDIGLNYYIGLPQSVAGDKNAYVKLSVNSETYKLPVSEASTQNGLYKFTVWLSAKEMRDDVTFALYDGNGSLVDIYSRKGTKLEGSTFNYTLEKYFNAISSTGNQTLKNLAEATLTYGAYAQNAFNHNPDASYDGTELSAVTAEVLEKYKMTKSAEIPSGLTLTEITLILNTKTAFRLYFKADNIDAYSFVLDGNEVKPSYIAGENLYYIELVDIHAKELDTEHTLTINNGCDISFSALSYAYAVVKADKDANIVNVCKALYLYNEAANAYFTNNQ